MKTLWMLVQFWIAEGMRVWRKDDLDPVPFGERVTLPSPSAVDRESRPRHDTLPSRVSEPHPGLHRTQTRPPWSVN